MGYSRRICLGLHPTEVTANPRDDLYKPLGKIAKNSAYTLKLSVLIYKKHYPVYSVIVEGAHEFQSHGSREARRSGKL